MFHFSLNTFSYKSVETANGLIFEKRGLNKKFINVY